MAEPDRHRRSPEGETAPEETPPTRKKRRRLEASDVFAALFVLAVLVGVPLFLYRTCTATAPLREATTKFCETLRVGKLRDAHGLLASSRRSGPPYEDFVRAVKDTALRGHASVKIQGTKKTDQGWGCTRGELRVGDAAWSFELYLVKEGTRWRPHSWALHPPASMIPMPLLRRCGNW